MKKTLLFLAFLLGIALQSWAYSFSAVAPSGQRLYYNIVNGKAQVTSQNTSSPRYTTYPTGDLIIPSTVTYNGTTYSVTSIGKCAFSGCTELTSVTIPNSVTYIGCNAFSQCSGLTGTLTIPNSVTTIDTGAFYRCSGLTGTLTIPNSVRFIGSTAFCECSGLTGTLNIPNAVTSIQGTTFQGCTGLTSVIISNSVTSIGDHAFNGCTGLTSVNIPNSVNSIGYAAFKSCSGLTGSLNIPNSVRSIGQSAFSGCTGLTSLTIGNSVNSIETGAFMNCSGLTGTLNIPNSVTTIGSAAFQNCSGLTGTLNIPNSVTSIIGYTFRGCSGLTSVNIPNSVTSIGDYAFCSCSGLTGTLNIPNSVTSIGERAFSFCSGLTGSLNIPNSVTSIGNSAFSYCSGLTSATIGNSVNSIGSEAFLHCSGLTSVTIGNSVNSIGSYAFEECTGLTEIHSLNNVAPSLRYYGVFNQVTSTIPIYIPCGSLESYQTGWTYFSNFIEVSGIDFNAVPDNETMGTAHIDSYPGCTDSLATVSATANDGYLFDHWSDGSTDNPHTFSVTSGMTIIAYFVPAANVTVTSDNTTMGTASGSGIYAIGSTTTISATPNYGYHFTQWNDGVSENPRTIDVAGDTSFTAYFEPNQYTVNVVSDNTELGSVTGGGTFDYGTTITISAEAIAANHRFTQWNDGNTQNPRTVTVIGDATYTAYFAINEYTLTVVPNNTSYGTVAGGGTYVVGTTVTISAEANYGYHFTQWQDGNTDNPRTVTVTGNATYTANFEANNYIITVLSDNPTIGTVTGGGTYAYGSTISIIAQPAEGCWFAYWQDGNNDNPRYITVTGNAEYVAHFYRPEGIDDVTTADGMKIYTRGNNIVIETNTEAIKHSGNQAITVYDVMGRVIKQTAGSGQQATVEIPVTSAGVYMVKVGDQPSRKVAVRP